MSTNVTDLVDEQIANCFQLLDLPDDVLAIVVAASLTSPADVASVAATSRRLFQICKRAPFRLHLNEMLRSSADFSTSTTTTQEDAQAQLHEILAALCQSFPGTTELNLASLPLGNEGVVLVQRTLPSLAFLKVSGCKKLTSEAVLAATCVTPSSSSSTATTATATAASILRCIDMQRCYQLTADDLTTLLHASTKPGSKLSCIALSHLDLSSWSFLPHKLLNNKSYSSLRMLALHNGIKLTAPGLRSIVSACPLLEVLCLGGSVLELDVSSHITAETGERAHSSGGSSPTAAGAAAFAGVQNLNTNNITQSLSTSPSTTTHSQHLNISEEQQEESFQKLSSYHDPLVSQILQQAGDCGISPVLLETSHGIWLKNSAAELAAAVCRLPHLRILELTHCAPGLTHLVTRMLEAADSANTADDPSSSLSSMSYSMIDALSLEDGMNEKKKKNKSSNNNFSTSIPRAARVQIWDLNTTASVSAALHWRTTCSLSSTTLPQSDGEMILTAMARCSSPGRITALHSAAEDGDVGLLSNLLSLGAEVDARDRGGASALFCACEAGHSGAVAVLLNAGASATLRNAAGEAPLYIAALRGHEQVVEVLLRHCGEKGITWQDHRLYADGWTPLHAAAVSGRLSIAGILLSAAGAADAAGLVTASNRYGQTCVHVAARKGTPALMQLLIEAGGSASLSVADCNGHIAADVAKRHGNSSAWRLLTGTMSARSRNHQLQRATTPTVEKKVWQQPAAQHAGSRWVGRRLQQRKAQSQ